MDFIVDDSDARRLVAQLAELDKSMPREIRASTSKAALKVKTALRNDMAKSKYFHQVAGVISYDIAGNASYSEAQIGPVSGPGGVPGDLAGIAYFGGANGGGGNVPDPMIAAKAEAPHYEKALADILRVLG